MVLAFSLMFHKGLIFTNANDCTGFQLSRARHFTPKVQIQLKGVNVVCCVGSVEIQIEI